MLARIISLSLLVSVTQAYFPSKAIVSEALAPISVYHDVSNIKLEQAKYDLMKYKPEKVDLYHPYWHWQWD